MDIPRKTLCILVVLLAGCASTVEENHYFATYSANAGEREKPINFFRLQLNGASQFSNARYLSGYYDERAVDLFFNELKAPTNQKLFEDERKIPGEETAKLKPLSPGPENGAFVLILSTNVDSIANAIGSFSESQVVAQALTRLVNKDRYKEKAKSDVEVVSKTAQATALVSKIELHLNSAKIATTGDQARQSYVRTLYALAQALGYRGAVFAGFEEARTWFDTEIDQSRSAP